MKIEVENGKYTFYTKDNDYRIFIDRGDGKEWVIIEAGSKAILALMFDLEEMRTKLLRSEDQLLDAKVWF